MLKYIIIDDEPLAHEIIEEFCSMLPHVQSSIRTVIMQWKLCSI